MDALTHLLVGRLLSVPLGAESAALGWLATLFAVLPDLDTLSWAFPKLRRWVRHRGVTHTLPFGVAASAAAGVTFALAGWSGFLVAFGVALLAFLSHVALDVLNWGAPVLWPWRRRSLEWTLHGGFVWSALLSASAVAALTLVQARMPSAAPGLATFLAGGFAAYLALRAGLRLWMARKHPKGRLVPTGNPFVWRVLEPVDVPG